MKISELLNDCTDGKVVIVDTTTMLDCGTVYVPSPLVSVIGDLEVVEWKSSATNKITIYCELTEPTEVPGTDTDVSDETTEEEGE